jgi:lactoylglutathione lyase
MIKGLYETHLYVKDRQQSITFYRDVLGLKFCYEQPERKVAFFWIGKPKEYLLGLWEKPVEEVQSRHFAFRCDVDDVLNKSIGYLKERGLKPYNFLNDGIELPMVFAWTPAVSIYFDDPDGHVLEFIAILDGEGKPELGVISWDEWVKVRGE